MLCYVININALFLILLLFEQISILFTINLFSKLYVITVETLHERYQVSKLIC